MGIAKELAKSILPKSAVYALRKAKQDKKFAEYDDLSNREAFRKIYKEGIWGESDSEEFYSGPGSHFDSYNRTYAQTIRDFIEMNGVTSVVDIGCGDFTIGRQIVESLPGLQYTGVDIVPEVIENNQSKNTYDNVTFMCSDMAVEDLPDADLCLIKEVWQHLSNDTIMTCLDKTRKYKYRIVTEYYPAENKFKKPNLDKPTGPTTRTISGSAVCLDKEPFNQKCTELLKVEVPQHIYYPGETLRSFLL
ncbi:MAG: class I SAM-dependent methyltransferase [Pseudomonadota bacterium]